MNLGVSRLGPVLAPQSAPSSQSQGPLRIVVDDVGDADSGYDLQQIGRDASEQAPDTLSAHGFDRDIPNARIGRRVDCGALTLQSRSQNVDGIDGAGAERPADGTDSSCHDVTGCGIFFVTVAGFGIAGGDELFEVFEGGEV